MHRCGFAQARRGGQLRDHFQQGIASARLEFFHFSAGWEEGCGNDLAGRNLQCAKAGEPKLPPKQTAPIFQIEGMADLDTFSYYNLLSGLAIK
jgi:hypothetical protein